MSSPPSPSQTHEIASAARFSIEDLVATLMRMGASDLHLKVGAPPIMRVHGELKPLEDFDSLSREDVLGLLYQMLQEPVKLEHLHRTGAVDFAFESAHHETRMRVNAFHERGQCAIACRPIPEFIKQ